jgi:hypothetical protein
MRDFSLFKPLLFQVYATSEEFEIKALGSAYPSQSTPTANVTATDGSSPSATAKSGSVPITAGLGAITLAAFGIAALFA